jgi:hypothetical protein
MLLCASELAVQGIATRSFILPSGISSWNPLKARVQTLLRGNRTKPKVAVCGRRRMLPTGQGFTVIFRT